MSEGGRPGGSTALAVQVAADGAVKLVAQGCFLPIASRHWTGDQR